MLLFPAMSNGFSRQLFKDGERMLILSSCQICGEARIASSYGGSLQEWESDHSCTSGAASASKAVAGNGRRLAAKAVSTGEPSAQAFVSPD
jgi:hypothetical protein